MAADYPALMDPQTMGILSAAFKGLEASGPSMMPRSMGQIIGMGGQAGLGTFQQSMEAQRKYEQTQALIALEKQKAQQTELTNAMQIGQINYGRELQGLPPLSMPGQGSPSQGLFGTQPAVPTPGGMAMPQMGGAAPQTPAPSMVAQAPAPPQPMQSKFQRDTAHLPPQVVEEAKIALLKGDLTAYGKIIAEGAYKNVQGIGILKWDPTVNDYTLPRAQEEALAARTKAAEQAKRDVEDSGKADTYTFGIGPNARPVQTTAAIANALRTGIAPDEDTATRASQLAMRAGHGVNIAVRKQGESAPAESGGDLGPGYQRPMPVGPQAQSGVGSFVPGSQPTEEEKAIQAGRARFIGGRADSAVSYEKGINEKVSQGQQLDSRLDEMSRLTKEFKSGGGAAVRARLAELAQAVPGVNQKMVDDIAGGNLGSIQEFEKLQIQGAMESLRVAMTNTSGAGAGRITQAEFQIFLKANPNIALDPRGMEKILNFQKWAVATDKLEQQGFSKWIKNKDNDPADWPAEFSRERDKILKDAGIATPEEARAKWGAEKIAQERTFTANDLKNTAMKYKISVDAARKKLEAAGWAEAK